MKFRVCFLSVLLLPIASAQSYAQSAVSADPTPLAHVGLPSNQSTAYVGEPVEIQAYPHFSGNAALSERYRTVVLHSKDEWAQFWMQTGVKDIPDLSDRLMAVAVFLGKRPSAGYSVRISGIYANGQDLIVNFVENKPMGLSSLGQSPTSPWIIQTLPRYDGRVRFVQAAVAN